MNVVSNGTAPIASSSGLAFVGANPAAQQISISNFTGGLYLVAVMDWYSRFVLSWELSNPMETAFCLAALDPAFGFGPPQIFNSDQGSQFTSADFLAPLKKRSIVISMDGRGRALDNVFIKRLWRSPITN